MAHGAPDDSNVVKHGLVQRLDDLGELAARLGSPVKYHRRGDVLYIDDFEWGLNGWHTTGTNADRFCQVSNVASLSKGSCCLLNSGTGGGLPIYLRTYHPAVSGDKIGFHVAISLRSNILAFGMSIAVRSPSQEYSYTWLWQKALSLLSCGDSEGGMYSIDDDLQLVEENTLFHHFKMVVDQTTGYYVGLYVDDFYYDLSEVETEVARPGDTKRVATVITNYGDGLLAAEIALDDFVITVNE